MCGTVHTQQPATPPKPGGPKLDAVMLVKSECSQTWHTLPVAVVELGGQFGCRRGVAWAAGLLYGAVSSPEARDQRQVKGHRLDQATQPWLPAACRQYCVNAYIAQY